MSKISFRCIKEIEEAKQVWNLFTPRNTIYDEWEFRFCFYKYFNNELFFYVGYSNDEVIGVLPLQKNDQDEYLEFFGGNYMEDNRIFIRSGYEEYVPRFYEQVKQKYNLEYIVGEDDFTKNLPLTDYKYMLPLDGLKSYEDYLNKYYEGKDIREFRRKIRNVEKHNIKVVVNNYSDIELLFDFNIAKLKEKSLYTRPHRKEIFRDLLKLGFDNYLTSYIIDGQTQAVSLSIKYHDKLESFNTGIAPAAVKNLREYIYLKKIDQAIGLKLKYIDSFVIDYGWKENWHFTRFLQHKYP